MSLQELGLEHKRVDETLVATIHLNLKSRADLPAILEEVAQHIPAEAIAGPAFCIIQFISSYPEGLDAEVGFPVREPVEAGRVRSRRLPALQVLSLVHRGPLAELPESFKVLYGYVRSHGLISDEFRREVYPDWHHPEQEIELQCVLHDWTGLLAANLERVMGAAAQAEVMSGSAALTLESPLEERFQWVRGAMERLEGLADDGQRYDVVSGCAHVFPRSHLEKLRAVYQEALAAATDPLQAVDAVIRFVLANQNWGDRALYREGRVIYATKPPADAEGYSRAQSLAEKRAAYCFCPIVRTNLDRGMPLTFCYCGSGWYRQQWEFATGKPVVRIQIVRSILQGDDACQFAIELPDDLDAV